MHPVSIAPKMNYNVSDVYQLQEDLGNKLAGITSDFLITEVGISHMVNSLDRYMIRSGIPKKIPDGNGGTKDNPDYKYRQIISLPNRCTI